MSKLKLEVGKVYQDRDGKLFKVFHISEVFKYASAVCVDDSDGELVVVNEYPRVYYGETGVSTDVKFLKLVKEYKPKKAIITIIYKSGGSNYRSYILDSERQPDEFKDALNLRVGDDFNIFLGVGGSDYKAWERRVISIYKEKVEKEWS